MLKVVPTGHRVLIKQDNIAEVDEAFKRAKAAGLAIARTEEKREQGGVDSGVIIAIGENAWKAFDGGAPWAKLGDRIVFAKYSGKTVKTGPKEEDFVVLLNDEDILAVITGDENV